MLGIVVERIVLWDTGWPHNFRYIPVCPNAIRRFVDVRGFAEGCRSSYLRFGGIEGPTCRRVASILYTWNSSCTRSANVLSWKYAGNRTLRSSLVRSQRPSGLGVDPQFYSPTQAHERISNALRNALKSNNSHMHIPKFTVAFCTPQVTFNAASESAIL